MAPTSPMVELPALFSMPPTLVDPASKTRVWLFEGAAAVVDQTLGDMTVQVARFLMGQVDAEVQRRWVGAGRKVRFVHDWRSCVRYEAEAREQLIAWGRTAREYTAQAVFQVSKEASPFLRIAGSTAVGLLKALRVPIDMVDDLGPVLREVAAEAPVPPLSR